MYTGRKDLLHSDCGAHLIREAKAIAELEPNPRQIAVAREFDRKLNVRYAKSEAATDVDTRASVRKTLHWLTTERRFQKHPDLGRFTRRIAKNFKGVIAFLGRPDIPRNNNAAKRDIRPLAGHRNVVGSTRTANGSRALGHWMSVTQTLRKSGTHLVHWRPAALPAWRNGQPLPAVCKSHAKI